MSLNIGIDFGGVLSVHDEPNADGASHKSTAINIVDAVDSLKLLKEAGHKLYLNSFCGRRRAVETKAAIEKEIPNIFDGIYFVKSKKYKDDITKFIGCDVMIDDTLDILVNIHHSKTCSNLFWFQGDPTFSDKRKIPKGTNIIAVDSWKKIVDICSHMKPSAIADPSIDIEPKRHVV